MISKETRPKRRHVPGRGRNTMPLVVRLDRGANEISSVDQFNAPMRAASAACGHNTSEHHYER